MRSPPATQQLIAPFLSIFLPSIFNGSSNARSKASSNERANFTSGPVNALSPPSSTFTRPFLSPKSEASIVLDTTMHNRTWSTYFVYYSVNPDEEKLFRKTLADKITVDFMGEVDFFLGSAFTWTKHNDGNLSVHMCQSAFTDFTAHRFGVDKYNLTPNMTPYRSGLPIDSIPPPASDDPDLARRTKVYQRIVGSINWLATCTRPDVAPVLTFLATYTNSPSQQHYKAAVHALKYIVSTAEYGISFHSDACQTLQAFNHFPHHHDKEAYSDATPPAPSECQNLTAFSDACWGGQFGNSIPDGTPMELFKFRSLSGFLICRSGGPISWKSTRQAHTALSSCEAEILATDACAQELQSIRLRMLDLNMADASECTTIYNDNQAAVTWTGNTTSKGIKHINLHETHCREVVCDGIACVQRLYDGVEASFFEVQPQCSFPCYFGREDLAVLFIGIEQCGGGMCIVTYFCSP